MSALPASIRAPAERTAPPRDLEVRPKQVKAWLEGLPLARCAEAAQQMSAHLGALNRAKLETDDRVQILESYRAVAATILEELEAICGKAGLPLNSRGREALTLARSIAFELAAGYRIAITEKTGKLIAFGAKKQLPLLAARALEYLGAELLASYKSYSPVPSVVWRELTSSTSSPRSRASPPSPPTRKRRPRPRISTPRRCSSRSPTRTASREAT